MKLAGDDCLDLVRRVFAEMLGRDGETYEVKVTRWLASDRHYGEVCPERVWNKTWVDGKWVPTRGHLREGIVMVDMTTFSKDNAVRRRVLMTWCSDTQTGYVNKETARRGDAGRTEVSGWFDGPLAKVEQVLRWGMGQDIAWPELTVRDPSGANDPIVEVR